MIVSWFSAGVSSAVATKLALNKHKDVKIIYTHIEDQHEDTLRFVSDCEKWFERKIEIQQSELKSVENACLKAGFVNSPYGASCTRLLKKRVRQEWEMNHNENMVYVWGFDYAEKNRGNRIELTMPDFEHEFPLIEKMIDKQSAHGILEKAGIKRPYMYELGYPNNNCIGCVKGGAGYWNKIKKDFPEIFKQRAEMERIIGGKVFKEMYLDELPEGFGRDCKIIVPDCGLFCDIE
jgi:hypothetical protein